MKRNLTSNHYTYKFICVLLLISSTIIAQSKDISKLSSNEKKKELIETFDWLQSKIGKDFYTNTLFGYKIYNTLIYNVTNPNELTVVVHKYETDEILSSYFFDLKDIYEISLTYGTAQHSIHLKTYEDQRLIIDKKNDESYITHQLFIYYDNLVSEERILKGLNYALKLAVGGKKMLKEKF